MRKTANLFRSFWGLRFLNSRTQSYGPERDSKSQYGNIVAARSDKQSHDVGMQSLISLKQSAAETRSNKAISFTPANSDFGAGRLRDYDSI